MALSLASSVARGTWPFAFDAANTTALRNGTNPQFFYLYGTFTDLSNYERLSVSYDGTTDNRYEITVEAAGTGTGRPLGLQSSSTISLNAGSGTTVSAQIAGGTVFFSGTNGSGYPSGTGGSVTQATSKATTVVLNKTTGAITLNAASLAADTTVSFTFTNSAIAAGDLLILNHTATGTFGAYILNAHGAGAGTITVDVHNATPGALAEAIVISYAVFKGATA